MTVAGGSDYRDHTVKILVIGSGGREHAMIWRLRQSPHAEKIWCAPGNGGIADLAECVAVDASDVPGLVALAERLKPDFTVVGPEAPLVAGIRNKFECRGMRLVGPSQRDARLEGSKIYAKEFMTRYGIPTPTLYGEFESPIEAIRALDAVDWPVVIKADGLCAGKGVLVAESRAEAESFIRRVMQRHELGPGGTRLLFEHALKGEELSFIVLTDGKTFLPMAPTRDHKRVFDGDRGPNTGGMGAFTMDGMITSKYESVIYKDIVCPTIKGLSEEGIPYTGFLYFGLMLTASGPMVLEYNCRLGDPETQPIMTRMDFDLAAAFDAVASRKLDTIKPAWKSGASACVVIASGGYPGSFETGKVISGLAEAAALPDVTVFHAGTKREGDAIVTSGGRVLGVTATGQTLEQAVQKAYEAARKIHFEGAQYRTDIGAKGDLRTAPSAEVPRV
ncbi:MAG TPA: phosphoribosylamine--glycine ligase [Candidatus Acidoferrales bacterium]|nr:phosphoribosylamine--glycine ligase [Candidatus Acidoferrales bacterium]